MKKIISLCSVVVVIFLCVLSFSSCGESLKTPSGFKFDIDTQTLSWKKVDGALNYTISVGEEENPITTRANSVSLEFLEPGVYEIKIKANSSNEDIESSEWAVYPFERFAESGLKYKLINNKTEYEVVGAGTATGDVVIEDIYRGKPVTSIGAKAFNNNKKITSIVVGNNVKTIGKNAFSKASELVSITIPEGVTEIGEYAFQSCKKLESITLPNSVTVVPAYAFSWCTNLKSVTIGNAVVSIGDSAFSPCEALQEINLPATVKSIGEYAFSDCTALQKANLGEVETLAPFAFLNCHALSEVTFGNSLVSIDSGVFGFCLALETATLPATLETIGTQAFYGCEKLLNVSIGDALTSIGSGAFEGTKLYQTEDDVVYLGNWLLIAKNKEIEVVTIKAGTVGIADSAFAKCTKLGDVTLSGVKYIGTSAFGGCTDLYGVYCDDALLSIGSGAFSGCTFLKNTTLVFGNSLKTIGDYAFYGCSQISETLDLPASLTSIGTYAFNETAAYKYAGDIVYVDNWAVAIKAPPMGFFTDIVIKSGTVGIANHAFYSSVVMFSIVIPDSVEYIGRSAFYNCQIVQMISLSKNVKSIGDYAFFGCQLAAFAPDGVLILPDCLEYLGRSSFYNCKKLIGVTIPSGVEHIGAYAFFGCIGLGDSPYAKETDANGEMISNYQGDVIIQSGVKTIGERAFYGCENLLQIVIPDSVTEIGERAFYKCNKLKSVALGAGIDHIDDYMFYNCANLETITMSDSITTIGRYAFRGCAALKNIVWSGSVETIGDFAFYGCTAIQDIVIPTTVKNVGNYAFRGCTAVHTVIIPNNVETLGKHAFYGLPNATIYCEAASIPAYWNERWNTSYLPVFWGCEFAEDKTHAISFVKGSGENPDNYDSVDKIAVPSYEGYVCIGWATEQGGSVVYTMDDIKTAQEGAKLYFVWEVKAEEPSQDANTGGEEVTAGN